MFLELSAPEKDCSFVNIPDTSLSDIARLLQTIKYKYKPMIVSNTKTKTKQKQTNKQSRKSTLNIKIDIIKYYSAV